MRGEQHNNPGNFIDWEGKEKQGQHNELIEKVQQKQQDLENQALPLVGTIALLEKNSNTSSIEMAFKLARIVRKGAITATAASVFLFEGLYIDHLATQWKVTEKIDPQTNQKIYEHQDPKTTHLINILAGREHFSHEELVEVTRIALMNKEMFKSLVDHELWEGSMEDLSKADEQAIVELTRKIYLFNHGDTTEPQDLTEEAMLSNWAGAMEGEQDETVYETLWQMEIAAGSPELQIVSDASTFRLDAGASYNSFTNTTNLPLYTNQTAIRFLIAELSHGHQFNNNFFLSNLKGIRDLIIKVPITMSKEDKNFNESYRKLYDTEGTIENEAHSTIEPELQKNYNEATKNGPRAIKEKETELAKIKKAADEFNEQEESASQLLKQFNDREREAFIKTKEAYSKAKNPEAKKKIEQAYIKELEEIRRQRAEAIKNLMML